MNKTHIKTFTYTCDCGESAYTLVDNPYLINGKIVLCKLQCPICLKIMTTDIGSYDSVILTYKPTQ